MTVSATCFGGLFVRDADDRFITVSGRRADALLARLIWDQGRPVPRAVLIDLLWPEREGTGGNALRQAVHILRTALGRDAIETSRGQLTLPNGALRTDLARLRDPVQAGSLAVELSQTVLAGSFLAGLREAGPDHSAWLQEVRARADALAGQALIAEAEAALGAQRSQAAAELAEAALGFIPGSEAALRLTIDALVAGGNDQAAQNVLQRYERNNGGQTPRIELPMRRTVDEDFSTTHAVIAVGLILPSETTDAARDLQRALAEAGAEDVRHRHGTLTALFGREGLRHSVVAGILAMAYRMAGAAPRPAVGLCLARLRSSQGSSTLPEVDRARALTRADEAGLGGVEIDPALKRLSGADHASPVGVNLEPRRAFVGREFERLQIATHWQAMASERGPRVLVVSGPPGIGKSRLLEETVLQIGAEQTCVVPPRMRTSSQGNMVARLLTAISPHRDVRPNRSPLNLLSDILSARDHPTLMVLEDAETLSHSDTEALVELIDTLRHVPILFVPLARSEAPGRLTLLERVAGTVPVTEIFLGALSALEARDLAARFDLPDADRHRCLESAGGNPLFLNQLLHHVADGLDTACPASVEEAVAARLAQLDAQAMACMRLLAVLGGSVPETTLRELAASGQEVLDRLEQRRMLRRNGDLVVTEHGLIRAAINAMTPESTQKAIHLRAARLYQAQDPERQAWHLLAAGDGAAPLALLDAARAARRCGRASHAAEMAVAGRAATSRKALKAALLVEEGVSRTREGRLQDAERALHDALDLTLDQETRAEAFIGLANVHRLRDAPGPGFQALSEAEPLVSSCEQRARLLIARGRLLYVSGDWQSSIEPNTEASRAAKSVGSHALEAEALGGLADAEYALGDMLSAEAHVRAAIDAARAAGTIADEPAQNALLAHVMIYNGRLHEGAALAEETIKRAREVSDWRAEINAQLGIASAGFCRNELDKCSAAVDRVADLAARSGAERFIFVAGLYSSRVAIASGQLEQARDVLRDLSSQIEQREGPIHAAQFSLLGALSAETTDILYTRLTQAEAQLENEAAAHNALRVLPVAALLWRFLREDRRMAASLRRLRKIADSKRVGWATIMHDAIALSGDTKPTQLAIGRAKTLGFLRLAQTLGTPKQVPGDMLVC